jgi:hypothetical protein
MQTPPFGLTKLLGEADSISIHKVYSFKPHRDFVRMRSFIANRPSDAGILFGVAGLSLDSIGYVLHLSKFPEWLSMSIQLFGFTLAFYSFVCFIEVATQRLKDMFNE